MGMFLIFTPMLMQNSADCMIGINIMIYSNLNKIDNDQSVIVKTLYRSFTLTCNLGCMCNNVSLIML